MKKVIAVLLFVICNSCGTDQNPPKIYNYSIVNNSDYLVEIIPYNINNVIELQKKIIIPVDGVINKIYEDSAPYSGFNFESLIESSSGVAYVTKVDFVFNNSKKITYEVCSNTSSCSEVRSIFNSNNNVGLNQIYTITNEDFNAAIDCGGNCN